MTEIDNDGIIVEAQDLTTLNPGSDDDKRLYYHDGSSALSLTDGSTTTTQGYYLWNASLSGWIAASDDIVDNQDINPTTVGTETTYFDSVNVPTDSEYESGEIAVFNNGGELYKRPYGGVESPVGAGGTASGIVDVKTDLGVEPGDGQDLGQVLDDYVVNELGGASNLNHEFRLMNGTYTFKTGVSWTGVQHFGLVGERDTVIDIAADVEEDILDSDNLGNGRLERCFFVSGGSLQMNNITFDMNGTVGEFDIDASVLAFKMDDRAQVQDVDMVGKRARTQYTTDSNGNTVKRNFGKRITYKFEISAKHGNGYYENVHYNGENYEDDPDNTGSSQFDPECGIGFGPDPNHVGNNTFVGCSATESGDNGFYTAHSPGQNLLLNCYGRDNRVCTFRPGLGDKVIGGRAEWVTSESTLGYSGNLIRIEDLGDGPHAPTLVDSVTLVHNAANTQPAINVHSKGGNAPVGSAVFRNIDLEFETKENTISVSGSQLDGEELGEITFENCRIIDTEDTGDKVSSINITRPNVTFRDCYIQASGKGVFYLKNETVRKGETNEATTTDMNLTLDNCHAETDPTRSNDGVVYSKTADRVAIRESTLVGGNAVFVYDPETLGSCSIVDCDTSGIGNALVYTGTNATITNGPFTARNY